MQTKNQPTLRGSLVRALALGSGLMLAGCQSEHPGKAIPVGGGYVEVRHLKRGQEDDGTARTSLEHPGEGEKRVLIWPELYGVNEVIHGELAVFVGDVPVAKHGSTSPRLFLVVYPRLPVDVTGEILWRWARDTRHDFARAQEKFTLVTPVAAKDRLELHLDFWTDEGEKGWPDKDILSLDWREITAMLARAEKRAEPAKAPGWDTPYLRD